MKTSKFTLLVALAFALWFTACSDDDSGSSADASYVDTETLDEASSASADSLADDSDAIDSSDSEEVAGESSESSSSSEDSSSNSELGGDAASSSAEESDEGSSSSSLAEESSSSSAEESSSSEITISITIPVGSIDSTQVIPAGETVYATIDTSASTQCMLICEGYHVEQVEDPREGYDLMDSTSAATLTIDGEEYEVEYFLSTYLESPCAGNTYTMSASDDIYCWITF